MLGSFRNWLIRKTAGSKSIVLNVEVNVKQNDNQSLIEDISLDEAIMEQIKIHIAEPASL